MKSAAGPNSVVSEHGHETPSADLTFSLKTAPCYVGHHHRVTDTAELGISIPVFEGGRRTYHAHFRSTPCAQRRYVGGVRARAKRCWVSNGYHSSCWSTPVIDSRSCLRWRGKDHMLLQSSGQHLFRLSILDIVLC